MNLTDAQNLAIELINEHLPDTRYTIEFNHARKVFGLCNYISQTIVLSAPLVEKNSEDEVRNTILHEIAHAIAGYHADHGPKWQAVCKKIGAKPERYFKIEDVNMPEAKYTMICPNCNKNTPLYRKVKHLKACGDCCKKHNFGKFTKEFQLKIIQNY